MICGHPALGASDRRDARLSEHGLRRAEPHGGVDRFSADHSDDVRHSPRQSPRRTDAGRTRLAWLRAPASAGTALAARCERFLGVLVVIWHVPLILLDILPADALFGTFAFTIVFGWLFNNTKGSVLMTLIAQAADGLIITGNLGLNAINSERQIMLLVATWCDCAGRCYPLWADAYSQAQYPRASEST